jgi:hypothetical protein
MYRFIVIYFYYIRFGSSPFPILANVMTGGVAHTVEHLFCMHKAPSSNPSPTTENKNGAKIKQDNSYIG